MPPTASTLMNRLIARAKFRHLQVLIKLAELGNMRRAGEAMHMTQPAVSQLLAELETLMETPLFFRHARGVEPTAAAADLLPIAQAMLDTLGDGAETLAQRLRQQEAVVTVTASPAAIGGMIAHRLEAFAQAHPEILVQIYQSSDTAPLDGIRARSAQIICTRRPATIPDGWTFAPALQDRLIFVCGRSHPLAGRDRVEADELGAAQWLMNRVGSVARRCFDDLSERHGWPRTAQAPLMMHIPELTRSLLASGRYLAILPCSVAGPWLRDGQVREIRSDIALPLDPLGVLWRPDLAGRAAQLFAQHLCQPVTPG